MADLTNETLQNKYFLRKLIGNGATADVYLAWDKPRNAELAVKVLHQELANDSNFLRMFKKESEFMRDLRHPNIVRLYDFGQDKKAGKKTVFIVMEYIKGMDLHRLLNELGRPLSLFDTSQVLAGVSKALHFAHQSEVLHCDVKSANILIAQNDTGHIGERDVFITDFGVSRWALEQKRGGTPAYMAPELFQGGSVTEQTDIYALGITLYEMLSGGKLPFRGESSSHGNTPRERIAWEKANKPIPPLQQYNPDLPDAVFAVVDKALSRDASQRQKSIIDVWNELERARTLSISDQKTVVLPSEPQRPLASPQEPISPPIVSSQINKPHLFGISGEMTGQIVSIPTHGLSIGRSKSNQMQLLDPSVSRSHATIIWSRRAFYVRDEQSSLGTYLNGHRIPRGDLLLVRDGDRIGIGRSQIFEFHLK